MRNAILAVFALFLSSAAWGITPDEVLAKTDAAQRAETSHTLMAQTITTTSGKERTFKIEAWSMGAGEKSVMRFIEPAPSAGIGMLTMENGDNIWAYFPDSDDLRKIASSSKNSSMEGSDFSYEDMSSGGEMAKNWDAKAITDGEHEGKACHILETAPKKNSSYTKVLNWIDMETFVMHKAEYYDKKGNHTKTLTMTGWEQISGTWMAKEMVMHNLKKGSKTSIEMVQAEIGVEVDEKKFTTAFLTTF